MESVLKNDNAVEMSKIEAFEEAINKSDRFEMRGYKEDGNSIVVRDTKYDEDSDMACVQVGLDEILGKNLKCIMNVISGSRSEIVCHPYTRVVGYYSNMHNWNSSKISEARTRAKGSYGNPSYVGDNQEERVVALDKMQIAYGY